MQQLSRDLEDEESNRCRQEKKLSSECFGMMSGSPIYCTLVFEVIYMIFFTMIKEKRPNCDNFATLDTSDSCSFSVYFTVMLESLDKQGFCIR